MLMKIESLILKINRIKKNIIFNLICIIITLLLIDNHKINPILKCIPLYLLALYIVCFLLINNTLNKYENKKGKFEINKNDFSKFFIDEYILKNLLLFLLLFFVILFIYIYKDSFVISIFYLSYSNIITSICFLIYLIWATKVIINNFVITVALTRVIEYVDKNNLIKKS